VKLHVEYVRADSLRPAPYNPRRISAKALKRLAALLDEHGFVDPVIARKQDRLVIGGHQRLRANGLRERPDELVPVMFLEGIDDNQAKALNIALNNPAAQGEYDWPGLGHLLAGLDGSTVELPAATGFDVREMDTILRGLGDLEPLDSADMPVEEPADGVVLIFELSVDEYNRLKPRFDELIAQHDLTCHVRMDA